MPQTDTERAQYERWLELSEYWTPERMAAAIPVGASAGMADAEPEAPPRELPGVFMTVQVPNPANDPYYRRAGKLFFVLDGKNWIGSACAIHDNGILTAAHCLYGGTVRNYISQATYVPGYQDGKLPLGHWPLVNPLVPDVWKPKDSYAWDYGFSQVGKGGLDGKSVLGKVTDRFKLAVDRGRLPSWDGLGYPAESIPGYKFDGQKMWRCRGPFSIMSEFDEVGKEGNLTGGASGGPWLIPNTEWVNGVQSYNWPKYPNQNFSPYFDHEVLKLYEKAFPHVPAMAAR